MCTPKRSPPTPTVSSDASIVAVNCVELTTIVGHSGPPFHAITELDWKFVPFTVITTGWLPTFAEVGEIVVTIGVFGLHRRIVNVEAGDGPPPGVGFTTVTCAIPALATSDASTVTASCCVSLLKVAVRAAPFQNTADTPLVPLIFPFRKFCPRDE